MEEFLWNAIIRSHYKSDDLFDKSCFVEMFKYLNGQKDIPRLVFDGKLTRN